jgi:hypothetical protein
VHIPVALVRVSCGFKNRDFIQSLLCYNFLILNVAHLKYCFCLVLCLLTVAATGQSKFQLEFRVGANFSSLRGAEPTMDEPFDHFLASLVGLDFFNHDFKTDFFSDAIVRPSMLVFGSYRVAKQLDIQVGIGYNGRGMNLNYSGSIERETNLGEDQILDVATFTYKRKIKTDYLSVPVNLRYFIGPKQIFFVSGGVYVDFLLNSKVYGSKSHDAATYYTSNGNVEQTMGAQGSSRMNEEASQTSAYDWGLSFESGVKIPVKALNDRMKFVFTLGMNYGFVQLDNENDNNTMRLPTSSGFVVEHKNYYGLNSDSQNVTVSSSVSLLYQL